VVPPESKQPQPEPENERVDAKFKKVLPVQYFAGLAQHYMKEYGVTRQQLGRVSVKSHFNASPLCALPEAMHTGAGQ
jgi:acetyl-CoA acetyltransferase